MEQRLLYIDESLKLLICRPCKTCINPYRKKFIQHIKDYHPSAYSETHIQDLLLNLPRDRSDLLTPNKQKEATHCHYYHPAIDVQSGFACSYTDCQYASPLQTTLVKHIKLAHPNQQPNSDSLQRLVKPAFISTLFNNPPHYYVVLPPLPNGVQAENQAPYSFRPQWSLRPDVGPDNTEIGSLLEKYKAWKDTTNIQLAKTPFEAEDIDTGEWALASQFPQFFADLDMSALRDIVPQGLQDPKIKHTYDAIIEVIKECARITSKRDPHNLRLLHSVHPSATSTKAMYIDISSETFRQYSYYWANLIVFLLLAKDKAPAYRLTITNTLKLDLDNLPSLTEEAPHTQSLSAHESPPPSPPVDPTPAEDQLTMVDPSPTRRRQNDEDDKGELTIGSASNSEAARSCNHNEDRSKKRISGGKKDEEEVQLSDDHYSHSEDEVVEDDDEEEEDQDDLYIDDDDDDDDDDDEEELPPPPETTIGRTRGSSNRTAERWQTGCYTYSLAFFNWVIRVSGQMITQSNATDRFESPVYYFCGVMGWHAKGSRWRYAWESSQVLSAMIWCMRVVGACHATMEGYGTSLEQYVNQFLRPNCPCPLASLHHLRTEARSVSSLLAKMPDLVWSTTGAWMQFRNWKIYMRPLMKMHDSLLEIAEDLVVKLAFRTESADAYLASRHPAGLVSDPISFRNRGFSFVDIEENNLQEGHQRVLKWCLLNRQANSKDYGHSNPIPLFRPRVGKGTTEVGDCNNQAQDSEADSRLMLDEGQATAYLHQRDELLEVLLTLMQMCAGPPPRGTEATSLLVENTEHKTRNIYALYNLICVVYSYHKTDRVARRQRAVPRFLPTRLSTVVVAYLADIRPFSQLLQLGSQKHKVSANPRLFERKGRPWSTSNVSDIMKRYFLRYLGVPVTLESWRDIAIAIEKEYIRPQMVATGLGMGDPEIQALMSIVDHSSEIDQTWYSLIFGQIGVMNSEVLKTNLKVSRRFHAFWDQDSDYTPPSTEEEKFVQQVKSRIQQVDRNLPGATSKLPPQYYNSDNRIEYDSTSTRVTTQNPITAPNCAGPGVGENHHGAAPHPQPADAAPLASSSEEEEREEEEGEEGEEEEETVSTEQSLPTRKASQYQYQRKPAPDTTEKSIGPKFKKRRVTQPILLDSGLATPPTLEEALKSILVKLHGADAEWRPGFKDALFALLDGEHQKANLKQIKVATEDSEIAVTESRRPILIIRLPTGSGKTDLVAVSALHKPQQVNIMISPFIALKQDLSRRLRAQGIQVTHWQRGMTTETTLVLVTPETSSEPSFSIFIQHLINQKRLRRIFFDECHVLVEQFLPHLEKPPGTPAFRQFNVSWLHSILSNLDFITVVFMSGTLPDPVAQRLIEALNLPREHIRTISKPTTRQDLQYAVDLLPSNDAAEISRHVIQRIHNHLSLEATRVSASGNPKSPPPQKILISCKSISTVETLTANISSGLDMAVAKFHSKMQSDEQHASLKSFITSTDICILVGTSSLCHGINARGVSLVIFPEGAYTFLDFLQGAARAGRYGESASAILVLPQNDSLFTTAHSSPKMVPDRIAFQKFALEKSCRIESIRAYLDDHQTGDVRCERCDNCRHNKPTQNQHSVNSNIININSSAPMAELQQNPDSINQKMPKSMHLPQNSKIVPSSITSTGDKLAMVNSLPSLDPHAPDRDRLTTVNRSPYRDYIPRDPCETPQKPIGLDNSDVRPEVPDMETPITMDMDGWGLQRNFLLDNSLIRRTNTDPLTSASRLDGFTRNLLTRGSLPDAESPGLPRPAPPSIWRNGFCRQYSTPQMVDSLSPIAGPAFHSMHQYGSSGMTDGSSAITLVPNSDDAWCTNQSNTEPWGPLSATLGPDLGEDLMQMLVPNSLQSGNHGHSPLPSAYSMSSPSSLQSQQSLHTHPPPEPMLFAASNESPEVTTSPFSTKSSQNTYAQLGSPTMHPDIHLLKQTLDQLTKDCIPCLLGGQSSHSPCRARKAEATGTTSLSLCPGTPSTPPYSKFINGFCALVRRMNVIPPNYGIHYGCFLPYSVHLEQPSTAACSLRDLVPSVLLCASTQSRLRHLFHDRGYKLGLEANKSLIKKLFAWTPMGDTDQASFEFLNILLDIFRIVTSN